MRLTIRERKALTKALAERTCSRPVAGRVAPLSATADLILCFGQPKATPSHSPSCVQRHQSISGTFLPEATTPISSGLFVDAAERKIDQTGEVGK